MNEVKHTIELWSYNQKVEYLLEKIEELEERIEALEAQISNESEGD